MIFEGVSRVFQGGFEKTFKVFQKVSCCMALIAASRAEGGLFFLNPSQWISIFTIVPLEFFYPIFFVSIRFCLKTRLEELCHQDGSRLLFPTFRQILLHLLKSRRALPCHRNVARPHFPAFKKLLSFLV